MPLEKQVDLAAAALDAPGGLVAVATSIVAAAAIGTKDEKDILGTEVKDCGQSSNPAARDGNEACVDTAQVSQEQRSGADDISAERADGGEGDVNVDEGQALHPGNIGNKVKHLNDAEESSRQGCEEVADVKDVMTGASESIATDCTSGEQTSNASLDVSRLSPGTTEAGHSGPDARTSTAPGNGDAVQRGPGNARKAPAAEASSRGEKEHDLNRQRGVSADLRGPDAEGTAACWKDRAPLSKAEGKIPKVQNRGQRADAKERDSAAEASAVAVRGSDDMIREGAHSPSTAGAADLAACGAPNELDYLLEGRPAGEASRGANQVDAGSSCHATDAAQKEVEQFAAGAAVEVRHQKDLESGSSGAGADVVAAEGTADEDGEGASHDVEATVEGGMGTAATRPVVPSPSPRRVFEGLLAEAGESVTRVSEPSRTWTPPLCLEGPNAPPVTAVLTGLLATAESSCKSAVALQNLLSVAEASDPALPAQLLQQPSSPLHSLPSCLEAAHESATAIRRALSELLRPALQLGDSEYPKTKGLQDSTAMSLWTQSREPSSQWDGASVRKRHGSDESQQAGATAGAGICGPQAQKSPANAKQTRDGTRFQKRRGEVPQVAMDAKPSDNKAVPEPVSAADTRPTRPGPLPVKPATPDEFDPVAVLRRTVQSLQAAKEKAELTWGAATPLATPSWPVTDDGGIGKDGAKVLKQSIEPPAAIAGLAEKLRSANEATTTLVRSIFNCHSITTLQL
jgi:hypothetical protein